MVTSDAGPLTAFTPPQRRWFRLFRPRKLFCPGKHAITEDHVPVEHDFVPCRYWIAAQATPCDRWMWVYRFRGDMRLAVEVSIEEQRHLKRMLASPSEILDFLDALSLFS